MSKGGVFKLIAGGPDYSPDSNACSNVYYATGVWPRNDNRELALQEWSRCCRGEFNIRKCKRMDGVTYVKVWSSKLIPMSIVFHPDLKWICKHCKNYIVIPGRKGWMRYRVFFEKLDKADLSKHVHVAGCPCGCGF